MVLKKSKRSSNPDLIQGALQTPWGWASLSWTSQALCSFGLPRPSFEETLSRTGILVPPEPKAVLEAHSVTLFVFGEPPGEPPSWMPRFLAQFSQYFRGEKLMFEVPLDLSAGTTFQQAVWEEARKIPWGQVSTYGELAKAIGNPAASRAVGGALGANPLPLVVPCHRVLGCGGKMGGFSDGLPRKEWMLKLEGTLPPGRTMSPRA